MKKIKITKLFRNWWRIRHILYDICGMFCRPRLSRPYCAIRHWYLKKRGLTFDKD